ncbi:MAG: hypothetical protein OXH57_09425, partial [Ekhidna sp.]|nr:hypothetical protein [Ekhidna sp.]
MFKIAKSGSILTILNFLSCETADDIGIQYELQSRANVNFVEFILPATNVKIDCLRTDGENRILVGNYQDDRVGSIKAESYLSMRFRESNIPSNIIASNFEYDSVRMSFMAKSSIPFEANRMQSFSIHQLPDTLTNLIYLSNKSEILGDEIGTFEEAFDASNALVANFQLSDEFGTSLFDASQTGESLVGSSGWSSFALTPASQSNSISEIALGDDTTRIYLYVTDPEGVEEVNNTGDTTYRDTTYVAEFGFAPANSIYPHYVNLERNNASGSFSMIEDGQAMNLSSGQTIIDPLAGISTSLSLSRIASFFESNNQIIINSASISFELDEDPQRNTLEDFYNFFLTKGRFSGPGLVVNPFRNVVMSDNSFLGNSQLAATSAAVKDEAKLIITPTLFFQSLYRNYHDADLQNELNINEPTLFVQDFLSDGFREIDGLILLSNQDVPLQ